MSRTVKSTTLIVLLQFGCDPSRGQQEVLARSAVDDESVSSPVVLAPALPEQDAQGYGELAPSLTEQDAQGSGETDGENDPPSGAELASDDVEPFLFLYAVANLPDMPADMDLEAVKALVDEFESCGMGSAFGAHPESPALTAAYEQFGPKLTDALIYLIASQPIPDSERLRVMMMLLGAAPEEHHDAVSDFVGAIYGESDSLAAALHASAAADMPSEEANEARTWTSGYIRNLAVKVAAETFSSSATQFLISALADPLPAVRVDAAWALSQRAGFPGKEKVSALCDTDIIAVQDVVCPLLT